MKFPFNTKGRGLPAKNSISEILVLPDGRIFAHNISRVMAKVLAELNPADKAMRERANLK
jgi:hypothetical protein